MQYDETTLLSVAREIGYETEFEWCAFTGRGLHYRTTTTDVNWAFRMSIGEHPEDYDSVLWCMVQRLFFLNRRHRGDIIASPGHYNTLTKLLRAYSQPINPRWLRGGSFCDSAQELSRDSCAPNRLARRERLQSPTLTLDAKEQELLRKVIHWFMAPTHNQVPGAVHFAVKRLVDNLLAGPSGGETLRRVSDKGGHFAAVRGSEDLKVVPVLLRAAPLSVRQIQWLLSVANHSIGEYGPNKDGVDGHFGPLTLHALENAWDGVANIVRNRRMHDRSYNSAWWAYMPLSDEDTPDLDGANLTLAETNNFINIVYVESGKIGYVSSKTGNSTGEFFTTSTRDISWRFE